MKLGTKQTQKNYTRTFIHSLTKIMHKYCTRHSFSYCELNYCNLFKNALFGRGGKKKKEKKDRRLGNAFGQLRWKVGS